MTTIAISSDVRAFDKRLVRFALIGGLLMVYVNAVGLVEAFADRYLIKSVITLGQALLFGVPFTMGYLSAKRQTLPGMAVQRQSGVDLVRAGLIGATGGLITGLFAGLVSAFPGIRDTFPRLSQPLVEELTMGRGIGGGILMLAAISAIAGLVGAAMHRLGESSKRAVSAASFTVLLLPIFEAFIRDLFQWFSALPRLLFTSGGGLKISSAIVLAAVVAALTFYLPGRMPSVKDWVQAETPRVRRRNQLVVLVVAAAVVLIVPQFLGGVMNELLTNVGLFLLMGLGLNIVVGHAGLLDLGYVAFFAVGAYTTAVLTSPLSPFFAPELSWWVAFPVVLVMAAIAGIMVGTPVIRMRGDYLAIVTLGFGEIVRITLLSDWLSPYFGGAQGIRRIPGIPVGDVVISGVSPELMIYATLAFVAIAMYVSWRLEASRIGRAWAAMREDEDVAEAIGVDTVKAKLLAFVTGAILASFAGALFAAKLGSVFTNSFEILVSIIILVIVIVGGMGNIAGVAVGAFVLIGVLGGPNQPGLLQELGEFKLLIYGALLVYMMLQRPEGLVPSARRAQELHQEEFLQDAWLEKGGEFVGEGGEA